MSTANLVELEDLSLEELQARMAARALTPGDVVKGRVVALAEKIAVDPIQLVVLAACAAVLFTIVYVWVL